MKRKVTVQAKADAFTAMLAAVQALYDQELHRLVDLYRSRILAGDFCGGDQQHGPRHLALLDELERAHPWLATQQGRLAVVSCSRWLRDGNCSAEDGAQEQRLGDSASECLARDIFQEAASRGWLQERVNENGEFLARVA